jgi:hypothetical protein
MQTDQYRTEQFIDEADRAAYMRMIVREAYRYDSERDAQRRMEDEIIEKAAVLLAAEPDPRDNGLWSRHLAEVAAQIRDHRANGNYTTCHR